MVAALAGRPSLAPLKALLVDDDEDQFILTRDWLSELHGEGCRLDWVPSYEGALRALEREIHDVYLIDYRIGPDDGIGLLRALRDRGRTEPVIMLTGEEDPVVDRKALAAGASAYLTKRQLDAAGLDRALRYALDHTAAARQLHASERRFRSLVENSFEGVAILDRNHCVTYASPRAGVILGTTPLDLTGVPIRQLLFPPRTSGDVDLFPETPGPGGSIRFECCHSHRSDVPVRWIEAVVSNRLNDETVGGYVLNFRDVTERKAALQDSHRQSAELLTLIDTMQDAAPVGLAFLTCQFRFVRVNAKLAQLHGLPAAAHAGRTFGELFPELWTQLEPLGAQVLSELKPVVNVELTIQAAGSLGPKQWLCSCYPVQLNGELTGVGLVVVDVTEQRLLEQQFLHAQRLESVGRLAGGVAHDFNNLLTVILGNAELLRDALASESRPVQELDEIMSAGQSAAGLTQQLLAFSRKQVMQKKVFDLNRAVESTERMLSRLISEQIELVTHLQPDLEPVDADQLQIEQLITNLVVNARDAMPTGGRVVLSTGTTTLTAETAARHQDARPGRYITLSVEDTGCGMDAQTRAHAFEPFFTTKEGGKGTGLGLATVYGVVSQSGGFIELESEVGRGTTFRIHLPTAAPGTVCALDPAHEQAASPAGRATVLIAEDCESVRRLSTDVLRRQGYTVLGAASGEEALALTEQHDGTIDLLVTDLVMPGMNGRELAEQLRLIEGSVSVIYTSGYSGNGMMEQLAGDPRAHILRKPFRPDELLRLVSDVLAPVEV